MRYANLKTVIDAGRDKKKGLTVCLSEKPWHDKFYERGINDAFYGRMIEYAGNVVL